MYSKDDISNGVRPYLFSPVSFLKGEITPPPDKSISIRAVICSSLAKGKTLIRNFLISEDTTRTVEVFRSMGIKIEEKKQNKIIVYGKGLNGLKKPKGSPLYVGGSGATCRLLLGILAGQDFEAEIFGDRSLSKRPMARVIKPLREMGAEIKSTRLRQGFGGLSAETLVKADKNQKLKFKEEYLPIIIKGKFPLKSITYKLPIPSAQVKSAIILAGLFARGKTIVIEPIKTRDHTERMLKVFGADIKRKGNKIKIKGLKELISPQRVFIPSDISSAAFFIVAATIFPGSDLLIRSLGLNPTRIGIIKVLRRMGADIKVTRPTLWRGCPELPVTSYEPMGDIIVKASNLRATKIEAKEIPSLIDELPILMVAACFADGETIIKGVGELRVKETDRINSMVSNLKKMGADIKISAKGGSAFGRKNKMETIVIKGKKSLKGADLSSYGDHRTAMSLIIASLGAEGHSYLDDIDCINKSFPNFLEILSKISIKKMNLSQIYSKKI